MRFADLRIGRPLTYSLMTNHSCGDAVFSADAYVKTAWSAVKCIRLFCVW